MDRSGIWGTSNTSGRKQGPACCCLHYHYLWLSLALHELLPRTMGTGRKERPACHCCFKLSPVSHSVTAWSWSLQNQVQGGWDLPLPPSPDDLGVGANPSQGLWGAAARGSGQGQGQQQWQQQRIGCCSLLSSLSQVPHTDLEAPAVGNSCKDATFS